MMAAAGVPDLGGYEYDFVDELPDDWECLVCQLPLKDPVQIENAATGSVRSVLEQFWGEDHGLVVAFEIISFSFLTLADLAI